MQMAIFIRLRDFFTSKNNKSTESTETIRFSYKLLLLFFVCLFNITNAWAELTWIPPEIVFKTWSGEQFKDASQAAEVQFKSECQEGGYTVDCELLEVEPWVREVNYQEHGHTTFDYRWKHVTFGWQYVTSEVYYDINCPALWTYDSPWNMTSSSTREPTYLCRPPPNYIAPYKEFGKSKRCDDQVSNPICISTRNKYQAETDYVGNGKFPLNFTRYYNSGLPYSKSVIGIKWRHNYQRKIHYYSDPNLYVRELVWVDRPDGKRLPYLVDNEVWSSDPDIGDALSKITDENNNFIGWELHTPNNELERYDADGNLVSIRDLNGNTQTLVYQDGELHSVSTDYGESLTFTYDNKQRISEIEDHTGRVWKYQYDAFGNIQYVIEPDGTPLDESDNPRKQYHFENTSYPYALTGITDQRNIRFSTYGYDNSGLAFSSTHAGNAGLTTISKYRSDYRVTDSRGTVSVYKVDEVLGTGATTQITVKGKKKKSFQYDPDTGNLIQKWIDGVTTEYGNYNQYGQYGYKIEALNTPVERRTDFTYDTRFFNRVSSINEPSVFSGKWKVTSFLYNDQGNVLSQTISGFDTEGNAVDRSIIMSYDGPHGQLTQIDGPRSDVQDTTQYNYYPDDVSQDFNRGRLKEVVLANGILLASNIQYSSTGKIASVARPNGVTDTFTYYPGNDRLETYTQSTSSGSRITHWTYLPSGEVESISRAYGSPLETTITLGYDDARRLVDIADSLGNHIHYTLDTEGNRVEENVYDADGVLKTTLTRIFDIYNRIDKIILPSSTMDLDFKPDGTLQTVVDGKRNATVYEYDALMRLTKTIQPGNINASYDYNTAGRLTQVGDPNGNATQYSVDDLGNIRQQVSPDTGTTVYQYDSASNVIGQTDANGQTTIYQYDALNRLVKASYADGTIDTYTYDSGVNGLGHLSQVASHDSNGLLVTLVEYNYTPFGEVSEQRQTAEGQALTIQYQYNTLGLVSQMTYPSGVQVAYGYRAGRIESVSINGQPFILGIEYAPFGSVQSWQYSNGSMHQRDYDTSGRLTQLAQANLSKTLSYDENHNITGIDNVTAIDRYDYDALNRLTAYTGITDSLTYVYDANGNRTQKIINSTDTTDYTIDTVSNQLLDITAQSTTVMQYDANGNTLNNGVYSFQFDTRNRLVSVDNGNTASYLYNALGQRVKKEIKGNSADANGDGVINHLDITAINGKDGVVVDCNGDGNPSNSDNGNGKSQGNGNTNGKDVSCIARQIGNNPTQQNSSQQDTQTNVTKYYVYNILGQLVGEYVDAATPIQETVYFGTIPVALIDDGVVYTLYTDHLNTPRAITDDQGVVVWRWEGEPFGAVEADEDPDENGVAFHFQGRFAGQYYDSETGLHYNYYRYYDPSTGRYITSDPIGLMGGLNTYGYVDGNPTHWVDPAGLLKVIAEGAELSQALMRFSDTAAGLEIMKKLDELYPEDDLDITISPTSKCISKYDLKSMRIQINPNFDDMFVNNGVVDKPPLEVIIGHELGHFIAINGDPNGPNLPVPGTASFKQDYERWELHNIINPWENPLRSELGLPERTKYFPDIEGKCECNN